MHQLVWQDPVFKKLLGGDQKDNTGCLQPLCMVSWELPGVQLPKPGVSPAYQSTMCPSKETIFPYYFILKLILCGL